MYSGSHLMNSIPVILSYTSSFRPFFYNNSCQHSNVQYYSIVYLEPNCLICFPAFALNKCYWELMLWDILCLLFLFYISFLSVHPHPLCKSSLNTFRFNSILLISSWRNIFQGILIYFHLDRFFSSLLHVCHFDICLYHPTGKNLFTSFFCCIT